MISIRVILSYLNKLAIFDAEDFSKELERRKRERGGQFAGEAKAEQDKARHKFLMRNEPSYSLRHRKLEVIEKDEAERRQHEKRRWIEQVLRRPEDLDWIIENRNLYPRDPEVKELLLKLLTKSPSRVMEFLHRGWVQVDEVQDALLAHAAEHPRALVTFIDEGKLDPKDIKVREQMAFLSLSLPDSEFKEVLPKPWYQNFLRGVAEQNKDLGQDLRDRGWLL